MESELRAISHNLKGIFWQKSERVGDSRHEIDPVSGIQSNLPGTLRIAIMDKGIMRRYCLGTNTHVAGGSFPPRYAVFEATGFHHSLLAFGDESFCDGRLTSGSEVRSGEGVIPWINFDLGRHRVSFFCAKIWSTTSSLMVQTLLS